MKNKSSDNKIVNPAVVASIVTIFLIMIGFNVVFAAIVSKAFGQNVISGSLSNPYFQIVFNALMGFLVGWRVNQTRNFRGVRPVLQQERSPARSLQVSAYCLGSFMSTVVTSAHTEQLFLLRMSIFAFMDCLPSWVFL